MWHLLSFTHWHYCVLFPCPVNSRGALTGRRHFRLGQESSALRPSVCHPDMGRSESSQKHDSPGAASGGDVAWLPS